jgi:hypothetical protein
MLEELIAEKMPHAKMVAMAKPPGSRPSIVLANRNRVPPNPALRMIVPISKKRGNTQ